MISPSSRHHYNPDWLGDEALLAGFIARQNEYSFLRDELARSPLTGSVQHHLLVGVRGSGKTTLLKRLAVAIRRDADLRDHLIALSFPEELYQVKNLADFWWAACEALADELDRMRRVDEAEQLLAGIEAAKSLPVSADAVSGAGLKLLQSTCSRIRRRPVLLVDNLDFVLQRIDKTGRKLKNPHSTAYWALREALSTTDSPIVIGGSVRLSEPFTDYDKAFYDFFFPTRLGKLSLEEVRRILERLADVSDTPDVRMRLQARPSRIETLYELTGGNPRALGLIFELLRQGATGHAFEDFTHLMDITTPYYKARFEELSEQAQVIMHAMAVRRPGDGGGLRFGHTAAEIGSHAGLPTGGVSAQLDILEREGLVEKSTAHGRNQYRIAEQLFRLWLQMRGSRRIRQNVIGLAEFLEAMFDLDELQANLLRDHSVSTLAQARFAFAVADTGYASALRKGLEAHGAELVHRHIVAEGGKIADHFALGDLSEDLDNILRMREQLDGCQVAKEDEEFKDALLGSLELSRAEKVAHIQALCSASVTPEKVDGIRSLLAVERERLKEHDFEDTDISLLFKLRARGKLPLPQLTPADVETACAFEPDGGQAIRALAWRLVGADGFVSFSGDEEADSWLDWGVKHAQNAPSDEWVDVATAMRRAGRLMTATRLLDRVILVDPTSEAWCELAKVERAAGNLRGAEASLQTAIQLDPENAFPWIALGQMLSGVRDDEAEQAFRTAIELNPHFYWTWIDLAFLLARHPDRVEEAEAACRRAIEIAPTSGWPWMRWGDILRNKLHRLDEAEMAYRRAVEIDPQNGWAWDKLGELLSEKPGCLDEAEAAFRGAINADPKESWYWIDLGRLLVERLDRRDEAELVLRKAAELDPSCGSAWSVLGNLLAYKSGRFDEAEEAFLKAIDAEPSDAGFYADFAFLMGEIGRHEEESIAWNKAVELDDTYVPFARAAIADAEALRCIEDIQAILGASNGPALPVVEANDNVTPVDLASALVSREFVEKYLAPTLADAERARAVLKVLRDFGYDKHARPLLLAFEAAVDNRADMLDELEPEIKGAAKHMFDRLMASPPPKK